MSAASTSERPSLLEALVRIERALAIAASHTPWTIEEWVELRQARADAERLIAEAKRG